MIVYDQTRFHGWGIMFHHIGSALFDTRSVVPALLSCTLCAVLTNVQACQDYLLPKIHNGNVIFTSVQFLISLFVVQRVRESSYRYNNAREIYLKFYEKLVGIALVLSGAIRASKKPLSIEVDHFKARFFRYIRAVHVLAVEEFQGFESPGERIGTITFLEEILLFREKRKATRMFYWIMQGLQQEKDRIGFDVPTESNLWREITEAYSSYLLTRGIAAHFYPFPLAQASLVCCIAFGLISPLAFAATLPGSQFIAPLICYISVWLTFGLNLVAQMIESPFDGDINNLPMSAYSLRLINDISLIEFSSHPFLVSKEISSLVLLDENADYDFPLKRKLPLNRSQEDWMKLAEHDTREFKGRRKKLRSALKRTLPNDVYAPDSDIMAPQGVQTRALGRFQVFW